MHKLLYVSDWRRAKCAECNRPLGGVERLDAPARYCDHACGAKAQPEYVLREARTTGQHT